MDPLSRINWMLLALAGCGVWVLIARVRAFGAPVIRARPARVKWSLTWPRAAGLLLAVALVAKASEDGLPTPARASTWEILLTWGAGVVLGAAALIGPAGLRAFAGDVRRSWRAHRAEWLWCAALTVLALVLRAAGLGHFPVRISFDDEESFWRVARYVMRQPDVSPFASGWYDHPMMMAALQSLALRVFGDTVFGLRVLSGVMGALHVPALYALARRLFGVRLARWSALVLALLPAHILFSRRGLNQPGDVLMALLAGVFLLRAWRGGRAVDYVLFGAALGMAQFFYAAGIFSLGLFLLFILYAAWRAPALIRRQWAGLALAGAMFALVTLPYYGYLFYGGEFFVPRYYGYVARHGMSLPYVNPEGFDAGEFLGTVGPLLRDAYMAYIAAFDGSKRYVFADLPMLGLVSLAPFMIGVWMAVRRWRAPRYLLPLGFVLLIPPPTLISAPVPHYIRSMVALPFAAVLIALGICALLDAAGRPRPRYVAAALAAALLLEVGAHAALWYLPWPTLRRQDVLYTHVAEDLSTQPRTARYYLIMPYMGAWSAVLRSLPFPLDEPQYTFLFHVEDIPLVQPCDAHVFFYVEPARLHLLDDLMRRFRGGTLSMVRWEEALLYARYEYTYTCPNLVPW